MEKECLKCGKKIKVKPSQYDRKKYCSRECKTLFQKENPPDFWTTNSLKKTISCSNCKKKLLRKPSTISNENFCCISCKAEFQRKYTNGNNNKLFKRFSTYCNECGKKYYVIKSRLHTSKYCSKNCLGIANGNRGKVEYKKRLTLNCSFCKKEIEKKPSTLRKYNFCNVNCMGNFYGTSDLFKGVNSGTWSGGDISYYGPNWRSQRRLARKRDNFTCQDCGISENEYVRQLSVHHIEPFRNFKGDWRAANKLSNLVTLCEYPCHRKRHSKKQVDDIV